MFAQAISVAAMSKMGGWSVDEKQWVVHWRWIVRYTCG